MTNRRLVALAGLIVLGVVIPTGRLAGQTGPSTAWKIGDVFVGIGSSAPPSRVGGVYRVLTPVGDLKNEPDLVDAGRQWTTGCSVDVNTGDLYTTGFDTKQISRFGGSGNPHPLLSALNVSTLTLDSGVPPLPPIDAIESIVFDRAGNMFVGAQTLPTAATAWAGHGWILKISKTGVLLKWWQVDAGDLQNPGHDPGITKDVHGVDWLDLSLDETTIYYTSEDMFIRSFSVASGTQGRAVPIHTSPAGDPVSTKLGGKSYALRILPPGDPANGFLVATTSAVYRVDRDGLIVNAYYQPGVAGYFALNITPDGRSLWTSTFAGRIYKFHIASYLGADAAGTPLVPGSMAGPFSTGSASSFGLCVKLEYTASQNRCFVTDGNGNAVQDAAGVFKTMVCTLPPLPNYCYANALDPQCIPPGTPTTLRIPDQLSVIGVLVTYTIRVTSTNPVVYTITGLPHGLTYDASTGVISGIPDTAVTAQVSVTIQDTVNHLQTSTSFTWTVPGPPTLTVANQTTLLGMAATPYKPTAVSPNGNPVTIAITGLPAGLTAAADGSITGTPTVVGVSIVTVVATDTVNGLTTTKTFTWAVVTNRPPSCKLAGPSQTLWPPNHKFVDVTIKGVVDPDPGDIVKISIDSIWQDEPTLTNGSGNTIPDGAIIGTSVASVRAERTGVKATPGDGRIYQINYTASDGKVGGACTGKVLVGIPHDQGQMRMPIDSGVRYDSISGIRIY